MQDSTLDNQSAGLSKPGIIQDDGGDTVIVQTAQGDQVPLSRSNPMHQQMLAAYGANQSQQAPVSSGEPEYPPPVAPAPPMAPTAPQMPPMVMQAASKSDSMTERKTISKEAQQKLEEAHVHMASSIQQRAEAEQKQAAADNLVQTNNLMELKQHNDVIMAREAQRQEEANRLRQDLANKSEELSQMKVDPNFFGRLDTGNKIMAGLAIALGGLGQAYQGPNGKQNVGLDMVMRAADKDIEAQKANISTQKDVLTAKRGAFADFLSVTQDERAAELAEKMRIMDIYKSQLQQVMSSNANGMIKAQASKELAAFEMQEARLGAEMNQTIEKRATSNTSEIAPTKLDEVPKEIAQSVTDAQNNIKELQSIKEMVTAVGNNGQLGPWSARKAMIARKLGMDAGTDDAVLQSALSQNATARIKELTGRVSAAEQKILEESFASIKDNPKTAMALLDNQIDRARQRLQNTREQYPAQRYRGMPSDIMHERNINDLKSTMKFSK